jgi:SagB-type dehydrogenase family enzyme
MELAPDIEIMRKLHVASAICRDGDFGDPKYPDNQELENLFKDSSVRVRVDGEVWPPDDKDMDLVIVRRRSTRKFSGKSLDILELATLLRYAYRPAVLPDPASISENHSAYPKVFDPSLLHSYVIVHKIDGLDPGIYYYAPVSRELRLVRAGDFRAETWRFGRDASAIVIHTSHLPNALAKYGDRAYRYLHMDAGHLGQRLNLCATGSGLGASGIGGFFDDEVNDLLGLAPEEIVVYITTLGRPAEDPVEEESNASEVEETPESAEDDTQ